MKFRKFIPIAAISVVVSLGSAGAAYALGFLDIITAPKTLFDRAIEARSTSDILLDNKIVIAVNAIMGKLGTIKASTEIYEQRLLITGLFDYKKLYNKFRFEVKKINDINDFYWHLHYLNEME
jgi:hypothetical protein